MFVSREHHTVLPVRRLLALLVAAIALAVGFTATTQGAAQAATYPTLTTGSTGAPERLTTSNCAAASR